MTKQYLDSLDVSLLLSKACKEAGGQKAWAEAQGISSTYVSRVLHAHCEPGKAILEGLGLVRVVVYRPARQEAPAAILDGSDAISEDV